MSFLLVLKRQIYGDAAVVKKALHQIASRLHDNPSRSQHLLTSAVPAVYPAGGSLMGPTAGAPIVGITPLVGAYRGYKGDGTNPFEVISQAITEVCAKSSLLDLVYLVSFAKTNCELWYLYLI